MGPFGFFKQAVALIMPMINNSIGPVAMGSKKSNEEKRFRVCSCFRRFDMNIFPGFWTLKICHSSGMKMSKDIFWAKYTGPGQHVEEEHH